MGYTQFDLVAVQRRFGVKLRRARLFPGLTAVPVPGWLTESFERTKLFELASEKARGEILVFPMLVACVELSGHRVSVLSGVKMNVDDARGLDGECDFIVSAGVPVPYIGVPILTLVEAKKLDIEAGLGQCAAQMVAARMLNERDNIAGVVYGAVTTGQIWQFLRLDGEDLVLDTDQYLISQPGLILAALGKCVAAAASGV